VALWAIGVSLAPFVFQKFFVQPSELALETPYLKNYIEFTRKAFQLDAIQETSYPALADLTPEVIGEEPRHDPEHSSMGRAAAAANLSADPGDTPLLPVL
jgi:hypothetical protein